MLVDFGVTVFGPGAPLRTHRQLVGGSVTVDGTPAARPIIVLDRGTLEVLAATVSDPVTGEWEITGMIEYLERRLLVISLDTTGNYNAEVADYVSQVASA